MLSRLYLSCKTQISSTLLLQPSSAFGTKSKILLRLISTISAHQFSAGLRLPLISSPCLYHSKIGWCNLCLLASANSLSYIMVQFIQGLTTGHSDIIFPPPFQNRYKKQTETHVSHINLVSSIPSAAITDYKLIIRQLFLP